MRTQGIIKIAILLAADFAIIYGLFNIWAAGGVLGAMLLYAWLGEFIALRKDRAVGIEYVDERSRAKLNKAMDLLKEEVKARFSEDVPEMKLHVLPTDEINACSYGAGNIAVTRGFFRGLQKLVLVIYQTLMGLASRASEYRADRYSCRLGYGVQLKYFLRTYVLPQDGQKRTLTEIIYASHPDTCKRLEKIERNERQEISAA